MKFEIKSWITGEVIINIEGDTFALALSAAVKKGANLSSADLSSADLSNANLRGADLSSANLSSADLSSANLYNANLSSADLSSADLSSANLYNANLRGANLSSADLSSANLYNANLYNANLPNFQIPPEEGEFIVYKKLADNLIAKLKIPENAKRMSSLVGRKCRAEFAFVLEIKDTQGNSVQEGKDKHTGKTVYKVGEIVKPDSFDPDIRIECTAGIHFFISRKEAEEY